MPQSQFEEASAVDQLLKLGRQVEAYRRASELADTGNPLAQVQLGWMYQTGTGTSANAEQAEKWYRAASSAPSGQAEFFLGTLLRQKGHQERALRAFVAAAEKGHVAALYHLGRVYRSGWGGVAKDETKARRYIDEAARRGHLFARRDVAYEMISGTHGVHRIPLGVLALVRVLWAGYRVGLKDPDSELALRL